MKCDHDCMNNCCEKRLRLLKFFNGDNVLTKQEYLQKIEGDNYD